MIHYVKGDVTNPNIDGLKILPHIVNSRGIMGSGVAYGIAKRWPHVKEEYEDWYQKHLYTNSYDDTPNSFDLGENQFVIASDNTIVVNMLAQKLGTQFIGGKSVPPIRLWALRECIMKVADFCNSLQTEFTLTCPKFGSLRAGGDFNKDILPIIKDYLIDFNVTIFEYQE